MRHEIVARAGDIRSGQRGGMDPSISTVAQIVISQIRAEGSDTTSLRQKRNFVIEFNETLSRAAVC